MIVLIQIIKNEAKLCATFQCKWYDPCSSHSVTIHTYLASYLHLFWHSHVRGSPPNFVGRCTAEKAEAPGYFFVKTA